ncbi:hypothetical protein [Aliiroseovarius sp. PrR006]|uniref:hypothetical protein n=1 Tax=Aliiroseovarius sp. PrR006 TaxID=2706883 RepID=UPI0013D6D68F|nr:hypothetical protein [Aliiroseovarius sp. PrR006]NDW54825.1 hypothetical protein [Aliiroseovarius sp. PrR006]
MKAVSGVVVKLSRDWVWLEIKTATGEWCRWLKTSNPLTRTLAVIEEVFVKTLAG